MSFNIRLEEIRKWTGKNPTQFGASLQRTNPETIRHLLKHPDANPGLSVIQDILETYHEINPAWLVMNEGTMFREGNRAQMDIVEEALAAYGKEQLRECQQLLLEKSEECGALKCELNILKQEVEYIRKEVPGRGQPLPGARAG